MVNVVDLMTLQPPSEHPHGLTDQEFDALFTTDKPIMFAFHGYPWLIHRLTYRRTNHDNLHVRGYKEEGTTTTPFDMTVLNELDRFHLVEDVIDRVPGLGAKRRICAARARQAGRASRVHHAARRGHAGDQELEVALAARAAWLLRSPHHQQARARIGAISRIASSSTRVAISIVESRRRESPVAPGTARRIAALFSPTPPVNAMASTPPIDSGVSADVLAHAMRIDARSPRDTVRRLPPRDARSRACRSCRSVPACRSAC